MSDHEQTWMEENIALPPTPGRYLEVITSSSSSCSSVASTKRESSSGGNKNKAKRKLDLEVNVKNNSKSVPPSVKPFKGKGRGPPPPPSKNLPAFMGSKQNNLKTFTIPKKQKPTDSQKTTVAVNKKEDQRSEKKSSNKRPPPPPHSTQQKTIKSEPKEQVTKGPVEKKIKLEDEATRKLKAAEEREMAKRMKTQAWAKILKHKKKLYIPHTSDPRPPREEQEEQSTATAEKILVQPSAVKEEAPKTDLIKSEPMITDPVEEKENCSLTLNITATIFSAPCTPVKMNDPNSIIRFMSITPQLLSPLSDIPRIFQ